MVTAPILNMKYPHTYILIPYTPDRRKRLLETMASIWAHTDPELTPYSFVLYENNYIGYPNAILNMIEGIDGFVFMGASDIILGKDWLKILWEKMVSSMPVDAIWDDSKYMLAVEPFSEIQKGALCQHPLIHSHLVKKYFHREYFHFYCDNEMTDRLKADGRFIYCPEAPMQHNHVVNGKAEWDEGYKVVMDPERNAKDYQTYLRRKAAGWPKN